MYPHNTASVRNIDHSSAVSCYPIPSGRLKGTRTILMSSRLLPSHNAGVNSINLRHEPNAVVERPVSAVNSKFTLRLKTICNVATS